MGWECGGGVVLAKSVYHSDSRGRHAIVYNTYRYVITRFRQVITNVGNSGAAAKLAIPLPVRACFSMRITGAEEPMNIHEYQAKALLRSYGAPVSDGRVVMRAEEAKTAAGEIDGPVWVVKAQIHAGGRGKGRFKEPDAGEKGGVRVTRSVEEAATEARRMLGRTLVTKQTGAAGKTVNRVYIEDGFRYRARTVSGAACRSEDQPDFLCRLNRGRHGYRGSRAFDARQDPVLQRGSGNRLSAVPWPPHCLWPGADRQLIKQCVALMGTLFRLFVEKDMEMLEINPLIVTAAGDLKCLDAKMGFDGNAIYRHADIAALRDETEEDPKELAASKIRSQLHRRWMAKSAAW